MLYPGLFLLKFVNFILYFRVQVIERGGTYFVVFMDSNQMPAPLRIKNLSDVPIQFYQTETRDLYHLRTFIQPHQSMDYAWDEPILRQTITCSIVGGTTETYDLQKLGPGEILCYENHICLAFEQTFQEEQKPQYESKHSLHKAKSMNDRNTASLMNQQQLVVDYIDDRLILAKHESHKRSQLWRMTSGGVLVHTGSSPPRDWNNKITPSDDLEHSFVLDIDELPTTNLKGLHSTARFVALTLHRYDYKRALTQTWAFDDDGYLCMGKTQMCVQVSGDLKVGKTIVLGPRNLNQYGAPLPPLPTMHIRPHRRLQGSGLISVVTYADGPTRILEIANIKANESSDHLKSETSAIAKPQSMTNANNVPSITYNFDVRLESGIGISIISCIGRESEELVYMVFNDISMAYKDNDEEQSIDLKIGIIVFSNQILTTSTPCLLYATYDEETSSLPSLHLQASLEKANATYKYVTLV